MAYMIGRIYVCASCGAKAARRRFGTPGAVRVRLPEGWSGESGRNGDCWCRECWESREKTLGKGR